MFQGTILFHQGLERGTGIRPVVNPVRQRSELRSPLFIEAEEKRSVRYARPHAGFAESDTSVPRSLLFLACTFPGSWVLRPQHQGGSSSARGAKTTL